MTCSQLRVSQPDLRLFLATWSFDQTQGLETSLEFAGIYLKEDTLNIIGVSKVSEGVIHGWTATE